MQGSGFSVQDAGFRVQGSGFRVRGSGCEGLRLAPPLPQRQNDVFWEGAVCSVQDSGVSFQVLGIRLHVLGSGFSCFGLRGLGFRVLVFGLRMKIQG